MLAIRKIVTHHSLAYQSLYMKDENAIKHLKSLKYNKDNFSEMTEK